MFLVALVFQVEGIGLVKMELLERREEETNGLQVNHVAVSLQPSTVSSIRTRVSCTIVQERNYQFLTH